MRVLSIIILVLFSSSLYSQISTSFSFGSLGFEGGSSSVYTGPVIIDGANACMTIQNGINLLVKESAKGEFRLGCSTRDASEVIFLNIFPNPSSDFIVLKSLQKGVLGDRFEVNLQDARGANLFQKSVTLTELLHGYRIDIGGLANGLYLVKVYSDKELYTYKIIKTGNLR